MRWPFRRNRDETDLRIFKDSKSGELTLRMDGSAGWPLSWEQPFIQIQVRLTTSLTATVARQLRDQLNALLLDD
jgi:hypothetical protein